MTEPDGWVVPEYRALARRPLLLGLPPGYAVVLMMLVLFLAAVMNLLITAAFCLAAGWGIGALVTFFDPYAWEILARTARVPRVIRPC